MWYARTCCGSSGRRAQKRGEEWERGEEGGKEQPFADDASHVRARARARTRYRVSRQRSVHPTSYLRRERPTLSWPSIP